MIEEGKKIYFYFKFKHKIEIFSIFFIRIGDKILQ